MSIAENFKRLRAEVPAKVRIVLACKTRTGGEVQEAIDAGAVDLGHNYVQEAEPMQAEIGAANPDVVWHMIGHLQKNKINKALPLFDFIQTVDSLDKARALSSRVAKFKQIQPVLIELNVAKEECKSGFCDDFSLLAKFAEQAARLPGLELRGLMTMGPAWRESEEMRPYFAKARTLFDRLNDSVFTAAKLDTLSMGMSSSFRVAIEEGATMIRVGTSVFGAR